MVNQQQNCTSGAMEMLHCMNRQLFVVSDWKLKVCVRQRIRSHGDVYNQISIIECCCRSVG
jgi:hypothetical protein